MGGYIGPIYRTTVELFNYQTLQKCQIGTTPFSSFWSSATVMNGNLIYCGGQAPGVSKDVRCYAYNISSSTSWIQVRSKTLKVDP